MTEGVRPISGVDNRPIENRPVPAPDGEERRKGDRRFMDRRSGAKAPAKDKNRAVVATGRPVDAAGPEADDRASSAARPASAGSAAAFAAQVIGQPGQKRGLKAGVPVREEARAAYLETEFSGKHDRRPPPGVRTRTKV